MKVTSSATIAYVARLSMFDLGWIAMAKYHGSCSIAVWHGRYDVRGIGSDFFAGGRTR